MDFRNYNDYEIIELIQQGHEEALQLMVDKYKLFIAKKISKFNLTFEYDDAFQEALIVMLRSIRKYKPEFNKTFTRFFELNMENHFISMIRKKSRYTTFISENQQDLISHSISEAVIPYYTEHEISNFRSQLSEFEQKVFDYRFQGIYEVTTISELERCDTKKVYNALDRIRTKLKFYLK